MKKGINKQVFGYLLLLAVLIVVAVYFLGYKKLEEKAVAVENNNVALQASIDELKVYKINEAQYLADMDIMNPKILEILDKYPSDVKLEDIIMQAVDMQRVIHPLEMELTNINLGSKEIAKSISAETVQAVGNEALQSGITFAQQKSSYTNKLSYESLKAMVQAIFDSKYNVGITGISYTADETELVLNGTIDLVFYSMGGNGKEYVAPNMEEYLNGAGNIFGLIKMPEEDEEAEEGEAVTEE